MRHLTIKKQTKENAKNIITKILVYIYIYKRYTKEKESVNYFIFNNNNDNDNIITIIITHNKRKNNTRGDLFTVIIIKQIYDNFTFIKFYNLSQ